jgi:formamidase
MKTMPVIRIDHSKPLAEDPGTGHNRWHPDIPPTVWCDPGDEVILETRDAFDGQMGPGISLADVARMNLDRLHPLTRPVHIAGAEPGDLLDIEILHIEPDSFGCTAQVPGFGFLRDEFPEPFKINWDIAGGWATSADLPGIRIPGAPFMGTIGLSPGHELLAATSAREQALLDRGGFVLPPSASSAVPSDPRIAALCLADDSSPRAGRQHGHQAAQQRRPPADPRRHSRRALLRRRRPLRPGRLRDLRHRHRDERHPSRPIPGAQR